MTDHLPPCVTRTELAREDFLESIEFDRTLKEWAKEQLGDWLDDPTIDTPPWLEQMLIAFDNSDAYDKAFQAFLDAGP